jgi:hypothetical protein
MPILITLVFAPSLRGPKESQALYYDQRLPQLRFAASEVRAALASKSQQFVREPLDRAASHKGGPSIVIAVNAAAKDRPPSPMGCAGSRSRDLPPSL